VELVARRAEPTPPETADPVALVEACRRGERRAIELVLRPLLPALERLLARLVRDPADVDDLMQSTLTAAIVAFPRFRGDASVKTWLLRIAALRVQDHWRSPSRVRRVALELVDEPAAEGRAAEQADARRRLARVYDHLAAIAPKKRLAFVLHVIDGRSIEEVAEVMDATVFATRSRVLWGRRALMARLRRDPLVADLAEEMGR
jgi:RNA polymerase sigma-70 factor (ECF subfamily)